MQEINQTEIKAQARRLRQALARMNMPLAHTDALNVLAQVYGFRKWEVLQARLAQPRESTPCAAALAVAPAQEQDFDEALALECLEAALRMQGLDESDLDELVHECLSSRTASFVNNQGMHEQLQALFELHRNARPAASERELFSLLCEQLQAFLGDDHPGLVFPACGLHGLEEAALVPLRVSVFQGTEVVEQRTFEALEALAGCGKGLVERLVREGGNNSPAVYEAGYWLVHNSGVPETRQALALLLGSCRTDVQDLESYVGVSCTLEPKALKRYVQVSTASGVRWDEDVLNRLGLQRR